MSTLAAKSNINNRANIKIKKKKKGIGQYILTALLGLYTLFCLLPIILVFVVAFSDDKSIVSNGFSYFPEKYSLEGFKYVFKYGKQLAVSYGVTIFITIAGTLMGLMFMSLLAYAMSRKDFRLRRFLSIFVMVPMLFSGGQLASYIVYTSMYHLKDSIWLLVLPLTISTMNIIILRTYIQTSIPDELMESARIDGASEYRTFFQIVLPLMKPALASVGFMLATAYWNDWQNALLYISSENKMPLQLLLVRIQRSIEFLLNNKNITGSALAVLQQGIPQYSCTMATVITVVGPIMVVYPFFQKYFIKGLTVGSVKG
ncbi:multiple sugar transport system permease protein [Anaerocolumna jejuensis DSM 15929]|uniref:Multiple sugar transport system permease protein n=1 Tax=Anaerocolumna jejuensis DSM 15929 TaxID=1121322 RepID=A0A1M6NTK9_9FIRM|nr:carbohydrate ABC transporter permease [Anaerocolumna jejuensis]SHJ98958.1 multiple sugar transport system permease protein [Anaerocolumna jejuensis DSM 15929]